MDRWVVVTQHFVLTFVEDVTHRRIIYYHHLRQIRLNRRDIFYVGPITGRAVLSVIATGKVLAILLEPVYYRVRIFLNRCGEDDKIVPFGDLQLIKLTGLATGSDCETHLAQKFITIRPFMNVI